MKKYQFLTMSHLCQLSHMVTFAYTPIGCVCLYRINKMTKQVSYLKLSKVSEVPQSGIHSFRLTPTFNLVAYIPTGCMGVHKVEVCVE